ncbi:hypothetical protein APHAL10511_003548 [Amanita phalloides]|nr:hypothetical protein APHAL10511_003548 [Amanita phalloides]
MFRLVFIIAWFVLASIFDYAHHITVVAIPPFVSAKKPNFWFTLQAGDSYTATGFNPSGTLPSVDDPLGNLPYPCSTASGGPNWVDCLTTTYSKSLVFTYDLVYDDATIDSKLPPWESQDALFSIWIGINDIGGSYNMGEDWDEFNDILLNTYFVLVEKLMLAQSA